MDTIGGIPFARVEFGKDGGSVAVPDELVPSGTTDVLVLSHGWKNDELDAIALYTGIVEGVRDASGGGLDEAGRRFSAIGVFWPAFWFREDLSLIPDGAAELGEGGAASVRTAELGVAALRDLAAAMALELGEDPTAFAVQAVSAAGGGGAADAFMSSLRRSLTAVEAPDVRAEHRELLKAPGSDLIVTLSLGGAVGTDVSDSDERGAGAGIVDGVRRRGWRLLSGGRSAVATMLNQASYYEMKARAGLVGASLATLLDGRIPEGVRVHLVGHSFGARLVTAACSELRCIRPASMSLLQAAYSHNGLGTGIGPSRIDGGFRRIVADGIVEGPIVVTHTRRDTAVGFLYALASTASGEIAKGGAAMQRLIGGPDDLHGGMGGNGAQAMLDDEVETLVAERGRPTALVSGRVNNVLADAIVSGHNDVANPEVGRLVWQAVR